MNVLEACRDEELLARWFRNGTWEPWLALLAALFALPTCEVVAEGGWLGLRALGNSGERPRAVLVNLMKLTPGSTCSPRAIEA